MNIPRRMRRPIRYVPSSPATALCKQRHAKAILWLSAR